LLSILTTNQKGLVAETAIVHECVKLGVGVARPLDAAPYDLILDLGPKLLRVQCKLAVRRGGVVVIWTRRCRRGREGHIHRSYAADEIDAIEAYCPDTGRCYLLPHQLSVDRALVQLRLAPTKNNQIEGIRWARDHDLGATLSALQGP
jgi:hypothetical protein